MRCSRARKLISGYVDGNLDGAQKTSLEQHLHLCPDCQQLEKDFQGIVGKARRFEKLTPSGRVWFGIKSGLQTEQQEVLLPQGRKKKWYQLIVASSYFKFALTAALTVVIIVSGFFLGSRYWRGKAVPGCDDLQRYTLAKLEQAEHHYRMATRALAEAVASQQRSFPPPVAEVFHAHLRVIDQLIKTCRQAIVEEPDDIEARNYLLAAFQEKIDFLNEIMQQSKKSSEKGKLREIL